MAEQEFVNRILHWQVKQIEDEKLLHEELQRIPELFYDGSHWYQSFPSFVKEEFREQLNRIFTKDDLNNLHRFEQDQFFVSKKTLHRFEQEQFCLSKNHELSFPQDTLHAQVLREHGMFSLGLVVALPNKSSLSLAAISAAKHSLVYIKGEKDNQSGSGIFFVDLPNDVEVEGSMLILLGIGVTSYSRIWKALLLEESSRSDLFHDITTAQRQQDDVSHQALCDIAVSAKHTSKLNPSQQYAVESVLQTGYPLQLIKGPPGERCCVLLYRSLLTGLNLIYNNQLSLFFSLSLSFFFFFFLSLSVYN
jgi:hypothetical protein